MTVLPQTPADCLAHCRDLLPPEEYRTAVVLIALLVGYERSAAAAEAIGQCHERTQVTLNAIFAGSEERP